MPHHTTGQGISPEGKPITPQGRVCTRRGPQSHYRAGYNIASFYGSSCAKNGKDALNTPEQGR
eukprot:6198111-Pyramimonas_sp.AAC.1